MLEPALEANTRLLPQLAATATAGPLARKGEPGTGVKVPPEPIANTPTASMDSSPASRNWPLGVTLSPSAEAPRLKGEPATSVKAPLCPAIVKTWTTVVVSSVTKRNWPSGEAASEKLANEFGVPAIKGDPATAMRCPWGLMTKAAMVASATLAA